MSASPAPPCWDPRTPFDWRDGERTIHFGRGRLDEAVDLLGGPGYLLLTTERAAGDAPAVVDAAERVLQVPGGLVDELAGDLLDVARGERMVALGGGRVIDVAKALVAANGGRALAVPTTLSGAEMTVVHRQARGGPKGAPQVRPAVVVADPALMASQPVPDLAASALNALGHAVEGPCTVRANPLARLAGDEAARLLAGAFAGVGGGDGEGAAAGSGSGGDEPDRDGLALGALLAGYAIDSAGYGLHHVACQTIVRVGGVPHAAANAIMLPHTLPALAERFPERLDGFARALGGDPVEVAARICRISGTTRLSEHGAGEEEIVRAADAAAERPQLEQTPPRAGRDELLELYRRAL